jgi:hypothetical protein
MTVQINIAGETIEIIPVDFTGCLCHEEKCGKVKAMAEWLKYKYRQSIMIKSNFEIIFSCQSKMNPFK